MFPSCHLKTFLLLLATIPKPLSGFLCVINTQNIFLTKLLQRLPFEFLDAKWTLTGREKKAHPD